MYRLSARVNRAFSMYFHQDILADQQLLSLQSTAVRTTFFFWQDISEPHNIILSLRLLCAMLCSNNIARCCQVVRANTKRRCLQLSCCLNHLFVFFSLKHSMFSPSSLVSKRRRQNKNHCAICVIISHVINSTFYCVK